MWVLELVSRMHRKANLRFAASTTDILPQFLLVLWIWFCLNYVTLRAYVSSKLYYSWKIRLLYLKSTGDWEVCAKGQGGRNKSKFTPCNNQRVIKILVKQVWAGTIKVTKTLGITYGTTLNITKNDLGLSAYQNRTIVTNVPNVTKKWANNTINDVLSSLKGEGG